MFPKSVGCQSAQRKVCPFQWRSLRWPRTQKDKISRHLMQEMIEYFCRRRSCGRRGVRGMLSLRVDGIGVARSEPWEYPFVVVQRFAESAFRSGRGIDHHGMQEMLDWFCARSYCAQKDVPRDISLKVRGIGSMICKPWQDPADVVDEFLKAAFAAGYRIDDNDALRILDYFCEQRYCRRKSLQQQNQSKESSQNSNMVDETAMDNDIGNSREVRLMSPSATSRKHGGRMVGSFFYEYNFERAQISQQQAR